MASALTKINHVVTAIIFSLGSPTRLASMLHAQGAALLDFAFEHGATIPLLPASLSRAIGQHSVVLPPIAMTAPENQDAEGLRFLVSLCRALDSKRVLEFGTFNGLTAWTIARNLAAEVLTLDIPSQAKAVLPPDPVDRYARQHFPQHAYDTLEATPGKVIQLWGDSATFDFSPWHGACDVVYIDGSHSEAYVLSDTERALRLLSTNGAIVWDDYARFTPGVVTALFQFPTLQKYRVPGTRLVLYLTPDAIASLSLG